MRIIYHYVNALIRVARSCFFRAPVSNMSKYPNDVDAVPVYDTCARRSMGCENPKWIFVVNHTLYYYVYEILIIMFSFSFWVFFFFYYHYYYYHDYYSPAVEGLVVIIHLKKKKKKFCSFILYYYYSNGAHNY